MTYIFLTSSVVSVGGAELYISRKVNHLLSLGWEVHVFSVHHGEIVIENLKQYEQEINRMLNYRLPSVHPYMRREFLSFVKSKITSFERVIIESHSLHYAIWGEYFARELGGVNIYYDLGENNTLLKGPKLDFVKFKYDQSCLYGITAKSMPMLGIDDKEKKTCLIACGCSNDVIEDVHFEIPESIKQSDYKILSFGRLNKPYISTMADEIIRFAHSKTDKTIGVILTGHIKGDLNEEALYNKLSSTSNINCMLVPRRFPMPLSLFEIADVCVAIAGCAHASLKTGIPTITVDTNDHKVIGIMGETTNSSIYRGEEKAVDLSDMLNEVLVEHKYQRKAANIQRTIVDYCEHDKLLKLKNEGSYYRLSKLVTFKNKVAQYYNLFFGYHE